MIVQLFSVYDKKAKTYMSVFQEKNIQTAIRAFKDIVNTPDTIFNKNPEDFHLSTIGQVNLDTGDIETTSIEVIATASQLIHRSEK